MSFNYESRNNGSLNIDLIFFPYVAPMCGGQNNDIPEDGHIQFLGTYEQVKLHSKRDYVGVLIMKLNILRWDDYNRLSRGSHKDNYKTGGKKVRSRKIGRYYSLALKMEEQILP